MKRKVIILIIIAALVLCLIPAPVLADDDTTITDLELTIEVPKCNTHVEGTDIGSQTPAPQITLPDGSVFELEKDCADWWFLHTESNTLQHFGGVDHKDMKGGNSYYARVFLRYYGTKSVAEDLNIKVNGGVEFTGADAETQVSDWTHLEGYGFWSVIVYVKVDVEHEFSEWETDPDSYTHATTEAPGIHIDRRTCSLCGETEERTIIDEEQLPPEPKPAAPDTGDGDSFIMLMLELCAAVLACIMIRQIGKTRKTMNGRK